MTPKQKSENLVDKYRTYLRKGDKYGFLDNDDEVYLSKQCALIAVDEQIDLCSYVLQEIAITEGITCKTTIKVINELMEIKSEIEKL
jgi:hypothetical protein